MARTADRDANHPLMTRFAEVQLQYLRMREGLTDLQEQLTQLRLTATSTDDLVTATVDARGRLVALDLSERLSPVTDPKELADLITKTIGEASARATDHVVGLLRAYLPTDSGAAEFVRSGDYGDLMRRHDARADDRRGASGGQ